MDIGHLAVLSLGVVWVGLIAVRREQRAALVRGGVLLVLVAIEVYLMLLLLPWPHVSRVVTGILPVVLLPALGLVLIVAAAVRTLGASRS